jgi:hypothetical protein
MVRSIVTSYGTVPRCGVGVPRSGSSSRGEHVTPEENVVTLDADRSRPGEQMRDHGICTTAGGP